MLHQEWRSCPTYPTRVPWKVALAGLLFADGTPRQLFRRPIVKAAPRGLTRGARLSRAGVGAVPILLGTLVRVQSIYAAVERELPERFPLQDGVVAGFLVEHFEDRVLEVVHDVFRSALSQERLEFAVPAGELV